MIAILSDAHLEDAADPAQRDPVDWLDGLDAEALVLGGTSSTSGGGGGPGPRPTSPPRTRWRGPRARYRGSRGSPANHDFAVGSHIVARTGLTVTHPLGAAGGGPAGGGGARRRGGPQPRLPADPAAAPGPAFGALVDALGERRGEALLERLAGGSRAHMRPAAPLVAAQRRWAEAELEAGADVVCLGHTHALGSSRPRRAGSCTSATGGAADLAQLDDAGIQLQRFGPDAG